MWRLLAIAFLLPWAAGAAHAETVHFASVAVGTMPAGPQLSGWLIKPPGPGPFPAIVLAHSCAGVTPHTDAWGARFVKWGYLVLAPDSFNSRGTNAVCTTPNVVTPNMRVSDVAGALDFLATRPEVIAGRIGLIGHSHGGSTTLRSMQKSFDLKAHGLRGGVAYYPGCAPAFNAGIDLPVLVLIGDKDDWTSADACRRLKPDRPELVEIVYYPNAYHSFDSRAIDRNVPGAYGKTHHLAYDPVAALDAEARTRIFFDKLLKQ
ncbi:dienelactone hydrolase family protein [Reyranella sp.]|uniref:dienelactone hydrolase family protein n=1 Tax=Reyranella sp. TaxID=1929291 RepID=UPI003D11BFAE